MVYVGYSGKPPGRRSALAALPVFHGLRNAIINGTDAKGVPRSVSWPRKLEDEHIEALDIYWYVTEGDRRAGSPMTVADGLLMTCLSELGDLPRWNILF